MIREWRADASYLGLDVNDFYPEKGGRHSRSVAEICFACRVRVECLDFALENRVRYGIWGGHTFTERNQIAKTRRAVS